VAADKGYHAAATVEMCDACSFRSYIPEPKRVHDRVLGGQARGLRAVRAEQPAAGEAGGRGSVSTRRRSECCERSFAHICDTGGMRRSWLRGVLDVSKRYTIAAAAHNLGRILRSLYGIGKPRALQGEGGAVSLAQTLMARVLMVLRAFVGATPTAPSANCLAA